ncbi:MAG: Ion-translocating oxidoreductase complex subunit G [Candidatus Celerinatantimonas neptuna]|nr:MAG: Ion-translocating oxidoreductase complex subunit G [Candidatus Celerinatantimonas neptuna]
MNPSSTTSSIRPPRTHALTLASFAMAVALLVMLSNQFLDPKIAVQMHLDQQAKINQVLPKSYYDNDPSKYLYHLHLKNGQTIHYFLATKTGLPSAVILKATAQGYSGAIHLLIAIDTHGILTGVRVLSHHETPGLGDKIEADKSPWILQFKGLSLHNPPLGQWKVQKDGGHFAQFTGATITPRGVVKAIKNNLQMFARYHDQLLNPKEDHHVR